MNIEPKDVVTDVLVIGSGAAGTMAAIKAMTAGADVLVVTKGPFPSGNSTKAAAGYAAAFGHSDPRDNPDIHFADVIRNGIGLSNQKLVKTWVNEICGLTEEMRSWGLDMIRDDGKYVQAAYEGHTYPRMINHHRVTGKYVMKCLGEKSEAMGVPALSHTVVGGLFKHRDRVSGAWAFDYRSGELLFIRAKVVIMTTGGYGALYPVGDNVGAATGEGYGIAYEAGAEMLGMEFGHYLATPIYPEKMRVKATWGGVMNGLINEGGAKLYNGLGERFMLKQYPETAETRHTTESLTRHIGTEIVIGNGGEHGGIYLDLADVPPALETHPRFQRMWEVAARAGIDIRKERIEWVCYPHDLVGGIKIDDNGRTNVPGLYAAGEATGGSHGASRFGGSALSDCLVFGARAGLDATEYAKALPEARSPDRGQAETVRTKLEGWLGRNDGVPVAEAVRHNQDIAFHHLNVVRSEESLKAAFAKLDRAESEILPRLAVSGASDKETWTNLRMAIEAEGQVPFCRLMATASMERTESRGGFFGGAYRVEYPEQDDDNWLKSVVLFKANGAVGIRHEPIVTLEGELTDEMKTVMATAWEAPDDPAYWSESE